jgi:hypothetical protein
VGPERRARRRQEGEHPCASKDHHVTGSHHRTGAF